ncbi:MAG: flagellar hook-basal body protein [Bacillaceae bacterium]|nr:flagellar hook-basal body protein [Bacillaceae bacterium]
MNTSFINTVAGMQSLKQRLDTISHNVSNLHTNGYKRRDTSFSSLFVREIENQSRPEQETGRLTPDGIRTGLGAGVSMTRMDLSPGSVQVTQNPHHFRLEGPVYFMTRHSLSDDPAAREYQWRLTRDGSFRLDAHRYLVTGEGDFVVDSNGDPIQVPAGYELRMYNSEDGQGYIEFVNQNDPEDVIDPDIQLGVFYVRNPQILQSVGNNQWIIPDELLDQPGQMELNGNPYLDFMTGPNAIVAVDGVSWNIRQGQLEGSNVDLSREMTALLETQRSFQLGSRALSITDQMMGITNNLKG